MLTTLWKSLDVDTYISFSKFKIFGTSYLIDERMNEILSFFQNPCFMSNFYRKSTWKYQSENNDMFIYLSIIDLYRGKEWVNVTFSDYPIFVPFDVNFCPINIFLHWVYSFLFDLRARNDNNATQSCVSL